MADGHRYYGTWDIYGSTVCIVINGGKISKSHREFDLDRTMPNVEVVQLFSHTYTLYN